jgi:Glycosyl hydrolases family 43
LEVKTLACLHAQGLALGATDVGHLSGSLKSLRAQIAAAPQKTRLAIRSCLFTGATSGRTTPGIGTATARPVRDPDQPVFDGDFADPSAIVAGNLVYAFATNTPFANVPFGKSTGKGHAALSGDALPKLPTWSQPGSVWAPSVIARGPSTYDLYYATRDRSSGRQCISVATGTTPGGPYTDASTAPLVCPVALEGAIDPNPIVVAGTTYLLWKNDGNCCGMTTTIWSQALSSDGLRVVGTATALIHNDQPWEGNVVEAPSMIEHDGHFFLFYSGNAWDSRQYATGYAVCDSVRGPCRKPLDHPWLGSDTQISGPGGLSVFAGPRGETGVIYHAWLGNKIGYDEGGSRALFLAALTWKNDVPVAPGQAHNSG